MPLTNPHSSMEMIAMYIDKYLLYNTTNADNSNRKVTTVDIGESKIDEVGMLTHNFSGRAISKLAIAWQAAAYGTEGAVLDRDTFFKTVELHERSMSKKDEWQETERERARALTTDR